MDTGKEDLLIACKGLIKALEIAFDRAEGDLLGVAHNDACDAMELAKRTIARAEQKGQVTR